ncbi:MAG: RNA 2',3'-cyclic phosphodiesterase [Anaerolineales bacterium]|nr:RNA 2',3'-cyclic phosphodiesterase [Anaerolineales bacterium]
MLRTFIALEISQDTRNKLLNIIGTLQEMETSRSIRWVDPEKIHLTIKFLGDIQPGRIVDIVSALDEISVKIEPFQFALQGLGCFPNPRNARVLWVGLGLKESGSLYQLHTYVEKALEKAGYPAENKPYHPHLTLARIKNPLGTEKITAMLDRFQSFKTEESISRIVFMQSELKPSGSVYTPLHFSVLDGKNSTIR